MRKLRTIICTLLILTVVLMPCAGYAAAKTIPRPAVTVKVVNDDYIKVSWKKSPGAAKYAVYRATSKNGTYKKQITTTKRYYNDKKTKNKTTYYYKVKAISKSGKTSKYSYVKSGRIEFNGKITVEDQRYFLGVGYCIDIPFYTSGTDDSVSVYYDDEYLDVEFINNLGNEFLRVTPISGTIPIMSSELNLVFDNHERHYMKNVIVNIDTYTEPYVYKDSCVPDFGKGFRVKPFYSNIESKSFAKAYEYSDISKYISVDKAMQLYVDELEKYGFRETYIPSSTDAQWFKHSDGWHVAISRSDYDVMIMIIK